MRLDRFGEMIDAPHATFERKAMRVADERKPIGPLEQTSSEPARP